MPRSSSSQGPASDWTHCRWPLWCRKAICRPSSWTPQSEWPKPWPMNSHDPMAVKFAWKNHRIYRWLCWFPTMVSAVMSCVASLQVSLISLVNCRQPECADLLLSQLALDCGRCICISIMWVGIKCRFMLINSYRCFVRFSGEIFKCHVKQSTTARGSSN